MLILRNLTIRYWLPVTILLRTDPEIPKRTKFSRPLGQVIPPILSIEFHDKPPHARPKALDAIECVDVIRISENWTKGADVVARRVVFARQIHHFRE